MTLFPVVNRNISSQLAGFAFIKYIHAVHHFRMEVNAFNPQHHCVTGSSLVHKYKVSGTYLEMTGLAELPSPRNPQKASKTGRLYPLYKTLTNSELWHD